MNKYARCVPMSRNSIRNFTECIRKKYDIPIHRPFPIIEFLEWCMGDFSVNYEIIDDVLMRDLYAEAIPNKKLIKIRESTYLGACNNNPRDIFTIAHEIGHIFLHTDNRISFARTDSIKSYEQPEWQANTFAGELLVPVRHIKRGLSVDRIASLYNVSYKVASIQTQYIS